MGWKGQEIQLERGVIEEGRTENVASVPRPEGGGGGNCSYIWRNSVPMEGTANTKTFRQKQIRQVLEQSVRLKQRV